MRLFILILISILALTACTSDILDPNAADSFDGICFESEVLPIFVSNCGNVGCHNGVDREEGLDLTNYAGIRKHVTPGKPL